MKFNTTIQTSQKSKTQQKKNTHPLTKKIIKKATPTNKSSQERNPPMLPRTWLCRSTPCHKLRKSLKETLKSGVAARRHLNGFSPPQPGKSDWERQQKRTFSRTWYKWDFRYIYICICIYIYRMYVLYIDCISAVY